MSNSGNQLFGAGGRPGTPGDRGEYASYYIYIVRVCSACSLASRNQYISKRYKIYQIDTMVKLQVDLSENENKRLNVYKAIYNLSKEDAVKKIIAELDLEAHISKIEKKS